MSRATHGERVPSTNELSDFCRINPAATGKTIWVDPDLLGSGQGTFDMQPQVANGRVYPSSAIGTGQAAVISASRAVSSTVLVSPGQ